METLPLREVMCFPQLDERVCTRRHSHSQEVLPLKHVFCTVSFCHLWIPATFWVFLAHVWGVQLLPSRPAPREAAWSQAVTGLLPWSTPPQPCVLQSQHSRGCNYHLCSWHLHRRTFKSLQHSQEKANKHEQPSEVPNPAPVSLCTQT